MNKILLTLTIAVLSGCATTKDLKQVQTRERMEWNATNAAVDLVDERLNQALDRIARLEHPVMERAAISGDEVHDFICAVAQDCRNDFRQNDQVCRDLQAGCIHREAAK